MSDSLTSAAEYLRFNCPCCHKRLKALPPGRGSRVTCPRCGVKFQLQEPEAIQPAPQSDTAWGPRGVAGVPPAEMIDTAVRFDTAFADPTPGSQPGWKEWRWVFAAAAAVLILIVGAVLLLNHKTSREADDTPRMAQDQRTPQPTNRLNLPRSAPADKSPAGRAASFSATSMPSKPSAPGSDKGGEKVPLRELRPPAEEASGGEQGDLQALQGKWKLAELRWAIKDGVSKLYVTEGEEITIKGDEMTVRYRISGGKVEEVKYKIELDQRKNPRILKRTIAEGKGKSESSSSIYSVEGDTLKRCTMRGKLPKDFEIRQGQDVKVKYLYIYTRVKPSSLNADEKSDTIWKLERTKDGRTVLSDGKLSVTFPAGAKVEAKGSYASISIKQEAGAKLQGYLSVERKAAPADAKKAADPRKWLQDFVTDEVEKDRKSVYKSKEGERKNYNDVRLVKTSAITLGEFKGLKSITDHERALSNLRIEGGLHSVRETDHYVIGDCLYFLRAGGSGAPKVPQLFGDHTGFHRSEMAQQFLKSVKVLK